MTMYKNGSDLLSPFPPLAKFSPAARTALAQQIEIEVLCPSQPISDFTCEIGLKSSAGFL